ncbi:hypothetical protein LPJ66_000649 [Kickxella alabastrina]|uniref:Uncharacterized protein n=1 Tax=Kickxella alabastrina TaxID=61397 RepID=A0ACC1IVF4_9FUNG|nr:hypothetical protein LPJ66_000649 [Kickxella alabastrina]
MVRLSIRSIAVMAFAVLAAALPTVDVANRPAVSVAPIAMATVPAMQASIVAADNIQLAAADARRQEITPMYLPQQPAVADAPKGVSDLSKMRPMVSCSESECINGMTPEEQQLFKNQCEQLLLAQQQKNIVNGQSRVAKATPQLKFFQLTVPSQEAKQRVAQDAAARSFPAAAAAHAASTVAARAAAAAASAVTAPAAARAAAIAAAAAATN